MTLFPTTRARATRWQLLLPFLLVALLLALPTGAGGSVVVRAAAGATQLQVSAPVTATAGTSFAVTVTAQDGAGATVSSYTGTAHFSTSDPAASLRPDYAFVAGDRGTKSFASAVNLRTAGGQTLTVTDRASGISGTATVTVTPGPATRLAFTGAPGSVAADQPFALGLEARDSNNNLVPAYHGSVRFTSSDSAATLPDPYSFTPEDGGQHSFSLTLATAGRVSVNATDIGSGGPSRASATVTVTGGSSARSATPTATPASGAAPAAAAPRAPAAAALAPAAPPAPAPGATTHFTVATNLSGPATAGTAFQLIVTALDAGNATDTGYTGTIHFTSTDSAASLPPDYTFQPSDNGVHDFGPNAATLRTAGGPSVSATDTSDNSISGSASIGVNPGAPNQFIFIAPPSTATANQQFSMTVAAEDAYSNVVTSYRGTVHVGSNDPNALLPADHAFTAGDAGQYVYALTLRTAGSHTVTVSDTASSGGLPAVTRSISVAPGAATHLAVTTPSASAVAGVPFDVTVTALDAADNTVPAYTGTVHFSTTDPNRQTGDVPADFTFGPADNGSAAFSAGTSLFTAGSRGVSVSDTATSSITGARTLTATPAAAASFRVSAPGSATAGIPFSVTVTALDAYGNTAAGYRGTVQFNSGDASATLPAAYTFTPPDNGAHGFPNGFTLRSTGSQSLTAVDSSITGTTNVNVSPSPIAATGVPISGVEGGSIGPVTVTTFTDTGCTSPGAYSATIAWGDTTTSAGTIGGACGGTLSVTGSHTYATEGAHPFTVTISKTGASGVANSTASINDAPLSASGGFQLAGTEGAALSATIATFTDASGGEGLNQYTATIAWGDNTTSAGTITVDLNTHVYSVAASHTYADEGSYTIAVSIADVGGSTAQTTSSATIADAPLTAAGRTVTPQEGVAFTGIIATLTDAGGAEAPGRYTVTIDWGDGTAPTSGTVAGGAGNQTVSGTHTYVEEGTYPISVSISDAGGSRATANATAQVGDAPLSPVGRTISPVEGTAFSGVVATITDTGGPEATGNYTATIDWGDHSPPTAGTISVSSGTFSVSGSHTYAEEGSYTLAVTVNDEGGATTSATSTATVTDAPLAAVQQANPPLRGPLADVQWTGVVGAFTDGDAGGHVSLYSATIDWGDGTPPTPGTVAAGDNGTFVVTGTHIFPGHGNQTTPYTFTTTVRDAGGASTTITTDARVSPNGYGRTPEPPPTQPPTTQPPTVIVIPPSTGTGGDTGTVVGSGTGSLTGGGTGSGTGAGTNGAGNSSNSANATGITLLNGAGTPPAMQLTVGCNQVTLSGPTNTPMAAIAALISPNSTVVSIWRWNNATQQYTAGYFADPNAPTDFAAMTDGRTSFFVCVTDDASMTSTG